MCTVGGIYTVTLRASDLGGQASCIVSGEKEASALRIHHLK